MATDLREYLAAERTMLAYVRTGIAIMGIGFVVARFNVMLRLLPAGAALPPPTGRALWLGVRDGADRRPARRAVRPAISRAQVRALNAQLNAQLPAKPPWPVDRLRAGRRRDHHGRLSGDQHALTSALARVAASAAACPRSSGTATDSYSAPFRQVPSV